MNIAARLAARAERQPDGPAIIDIWQGRPRVTTFAVLDRATARGAALLRSLGAREGHAVVVLHPMSLELYVALIAVFRLGMVAVVPEPSASRAHVAAALAPLPIAGFIGSRKAHLLRLRHPVFRRARWAVSLDGWLPFTTRWQTSDGLAPLDALAEAGHDTPALVTFTSGSTSVPKVAVRSHGFLLAQHDVLERSLHLTAGEVDLSTLPIFVLANLASGVTSVIPHADLRSPGRIDAGPVLAQARTHGVTRTAASPGLLARLADECARTGSTVPLRTIHVGGAPVFPPFLDRLTTMAPEAAVVSVYGSTEAEPIAEIARTSIGDDDRQRMREGAGLLTGVPVPEVTLRILAEPWRPDPIGALDAASFDRRCAPAGAPGEIVVTGGHVLSGYLGGRGDDETKFRVDGRVWHRTGDAGYLDDRGRLWLLGRCSARVDDALGVVYPFSVETAAMHVPGVARAAFTAIAGRRMLLVEAAAGASLDLGGIAATARWAHLHAVREYPAIPVDRRHNAKIDYTALPALLGTPPTREFIVSQG
ncbi:MAG: AMP-binding protein [Vicinamibacterales bacterium]